jgi:xanthine/uracil permease
VPMLRKLFTPLFGGAVVLLITNSLSHLFLSIRPKNYFRENSEIIIF